MNNYVVSYFTGNQNYKTKIECSEKGEIEFICDLCESSSDLIITFFKKLED